MPFGQQFMPGESGGIPTALLKKRKSFLQSALEKAALPKPYETPLDPREETKFQTWKATAAPNDSGADYDLRGAFRAGLRPDPQTGHWPDTFKKPNHPTFSDESQYAEFAPDRAGHWNGDRYQPHDIAEIAENNPMMPNRRQKLEEEVAAMDQPMSGTQKLLSAISTLAPTAIGAIFGGSEGATGASLGTSEAVTARQTLQEQRRKSLLDEISTERQHEFQSGESALTRDMQTAQLGETTRHNTAMEGQKTATEDVTLRTKGLKRDPSGNLVPITREDMGPEELADLENKEGLGSLRKAQTELAQATEELRRAQADPHSLQFQMAQERLNTAKQNAATASRRLGLSADQFDMRAFGTHNGAPLPGAMLTDEGSPVGSSFQQNVRPTGTQRNKEGLATSAREQLNDIKAIVSKRPDIFGPAEGRRTDFTVWVGSQDPDAQAFRAARTIAGDHLAGVFGGRSEAALEALDAAIGQFKDNPAALQAGLDQLDKANESFIKVGAVKTVGSNAAKQGIGAMITVISKDGVEGTIPFEDWPEAQKQGYRKK